MKREVILKQLQDKSSTSPNPAMGVAVFINLTACSEVYSYGLRCEEGNCKDLRVDLWRIRVAS
jgi:hypothetical protein